MKKGWQISVISLLILGIMGVTVIGNAAKKEKKILRYPYGCFPVGFKYKYHHLILTPTAKYHPQTVFFIHNISTKPVFLYQARDGNAPYIIHINTRILPNRWSVYAMDEKKVKFICTNEDKKVRHKKVIDCAKVLDICEFPRTRFGDNHRGNYWPIKNGSRKGAAVALRYHGVLLIDPKKKDKEEPKG
jgi:hypothetical protein